jgi:S1-C subfamily serine protease
MSRHIAVFLSALALPFAAWAAPPASLLGESLPAATANQAPVAATMPLTALPSTDLLATAARYEEVLGGLKGDALGATRGENEARIYKAASPAVVLIVTQFGLGSGVVVGPNGWILTNNHVVGGSPQVGVIFKPQEEGAAISKSDVRVGNVIQRDQLSDLALVKVSVADVPANTPILAIGDLSSVQIGDDVNAIGHPIGQAWSYTKGIVSQVRRDYEWTSDDHLQHKATVIQTQTPINPGNSGGPLIDNNLKVIGINAFKSEGENLNFAISADDIKQFLSRTGDRIEPIRSPRGLNGCAWQVLSQSRSDTAPAGIMQAIDVSCSGKPSLVRLIPDDPTAPYFYLFPSPKTGKIGAVYVDKNRDGNVEEAYFDTRGTGTFDMKAYFRPGESKPYRYERISDAQAADGSPSANP